MKAPMPLLPSFQADPWETGLFCGVLLGAFAFVGCGLPEKQDLLFPLSLKLQSLEKRLPPTEFLSYKE